MPEQPHNSAEEALQRYAKERRARGGDFALHPATRRMLQGEVARVHGAGAKQRRGLASWFTAWRMAGVSVALVVLLGLGVWMISNHSQPVASRGNEVAKLSPTKTPAASEFDAKREPALTLSDSMEREKLAEKSVATKSIADVARKDASQLSLGLDRDEAKKAELARSLATVQSAQPITNVFFYADNAAVQQRADVTANYAVTANNGNDSLAANGQQQWAMKQNSAVQNAPQGQTTQRFYRSASNGGDTPAQQDNFQTAGNFANNSVANSSLNSQQQMLNRNQQSYAVANDLPANAPTPQSGARGGRGALENSPQQISAASAPATQPPVVTANAAPALAGTAMRARRSEDRLLREQLAPAADTEVLTRFNFEQQGNTVRLVDADGSVYSGEFVDEQTDKVQAASAKKEALNTLAKATSGPATRPRNFRAAGTNVTLNQLVVVDARVAPATQQVVTFIAATDDAEKAKRASAAQASQVIPPAAAVPTTAPVSRNAGFGGGAVTNTAPALEGTVRIGGAQRGLRASPARP